MGSPAMLIQTVCLGGLILGKASSRAANTSFRARPIMEVWPPSQCLNMATLAPALSAMDFSKKAAFSVPPATTWPGTGQPQQETSQKASPPSLWAACRPSRWTFSFVRPEMYTASRVREGFEPIMAVSSRFTSTSASSKDMTPAAQWA
eukprot:CAMPEP_0179115876 /NCGR_PEP_ID=MMETSP0796-20121207/54322_1 /TAXON_ID=73915 /ORGANISM="Pyrodinium bahamense, Strain pbaha01" /LENGTH=147 /DNA_ID=CAMNT_0020814133 /DNA_START=154 /DNA_END=594 /DNA_ORIENTATION=+